MGNKLKELFNRQDSYEFKIHFNSPEIGNEFQSNLKKFLTDPQNNYFSVQGENIAEVDIFKKTPGGNFPLNSTPNIDKIACVYPEEPFICSISTNEEVYKIAFHRFVKEGGVLFENDPESIIHFSFYHASNSEHIQFHWKINVDKASSYSQLAAETEIYYYLLIKIANPSMDVIPEKFKENIVILYRLSQSCKRIIEVEKKLKKNFSPSKSICSENEMSKFEYIYQVLVKEEPVRDDISYKTVSSTVNKSVSLPKVGTKLLFQHDLTEIISVAEQDISLYTMRFYFNAVVNDIEENDQNNNKIIFTGTDKEPLYSVKKAYLLSTNAPNMTGNITDLILPIMKAKTLSEILSDLENQERTEVEELLKKGGESIKMEIIKSKKEK